MILVFCTSYHGDIHLHKVSRKYLKQFSSYRADTEITIFNVQRAITPKVGLAEVRFVCSALGPIMLYICVKFYQNI